MSDIDKARAQREALRIAEHDQTARTARAEEALQKYLGAGLYEIRHSGDKHRTDEQDTDRSADESEESDA
jgi:hypothetical protein